MSLFDWLFVGLLSGAIVIGALSIWMLFLWVQNGKKFKNLKRRKPKNKKKHKRWLKSLNYLEQQKNKFRALFFVMLLISGLSTGLAVFGRVYQANNLGEVDSSYLASSYGLTHQLDDVLSQIDEGSEDEDTRDTMFLLARQFSSFGNRRSSSTLTTDGQLLLNRYYNRLAQVGTNLNREISLILNDDATREVYREDITTLEGLQDDVFEMYSISEDSLSTQLQNAPVTGGGAE